MELAKAWKAAFILGLLCFSAPSSFAQTIEMQVEPARFECVNHLAELRSKSETWRWIGAGIAALGGITASVAGLTASRSERVRSRRRWGYLALISGALAAASPFLPKGEEFRAAVLRSDKHHIVGLKVQRQLSDLDPSRSFRREVAKYALARFTDCIAEEPPRNIPDLPKDILSQPEIVPTAILGVTPFEPKEVLQFSLQRREIIYDTEVPPP